MRELQGDQMYTFADNIQKLLTLVENYRQAYTDDQEVIEEMSKKVLASEGKVEQAVRMSQMDQDKIRNLRDEVKTAWKLADAAKNREEQSHELLTNVREKLAKYEKHAAKFDTREDQNDE